MNFCILREGHQSKIIMTEFYNDTNDTRMKVSFINKEDIQLTM